MSNPNYFFRSLGAAGVCLALLLPASAAAQYDALSQLQPKKPYKGREEGERITLNLETGSFNPSLPFDVGFKIVGPMPTRFGLESRIDARFVEFNGPPDCDTFFSQYRLAKGDLPDLNVTDAIPLRRRRRSKPLETSGFRQATVFDAGGVNLQARRGPLGRAARNVFGENLGPLGGRAAEADDAAPAAPAASFLVDFPPLRPNHYYCFQFIARRSLTKEDLEILHEKFEEAVDKELRDLKYQTGGDGEENLVFFPRMKDDYEKLRVTLSALVESELANQDQVVLAPPNSFFNAGAQLEQITAKYREDFESIARKTVGARLVAVDAFNEAVQTAAASIEKLAGLEVTIESGGNEEKRKFKSAIDADPTGLLSLTSERLRERLAGAPADRTESLPGLEEVWDPDLIDERMQNIQELSQAMADLEAEAKAAKISPEDLTVLQEGVQPVDDDLIAAKIATRKSLEVNFDDDGNEVPRTPAEYLADPKWIKADKEVRELQDQKGQASQVGAVFQVTKALEAELFQLRKLKEMLEERGAEIAEWVRELLVEERASLVVGATTVADYDTRASWYMSADVGSGISELEDFFTYVGWNIYFRPVNKKAHLSWGGRPFGLGEELMRRFSVTLGVIQTGFDETDQVKGVIGSNAAVLGAGLRINDSLRFSAGGLVFESPDPDPLVDSTELNWSPYVAISLDWNIGGALSGGLPGG